METLRYRRADVENAAYYKTRGLTVYSNCKRKKRGKKVQGVSNAACRVYLYGFNYILKHEIKDPGGRSNMLTKLKKTHF